MTKISTVIIILFFYCGCNAKTKNKQDINVEFIHQKGEEKFTTLLNQSTKPIQFYYFDKYNILTQISLQPGNFFNLTFDSVLFLIQMNKYQNIYKIDMNDTLLISTNKNGNAIFSYSKDYEKNNEINAFNYINEHLKLSYFDFSNFCYKTNLTNFKMADSLYKERYRQKLFYLKEYTAKHYVSKIFATFIEDYFKNELQMNLLSIPQNYRKGVSIAYSEYLDNFETEIIAKTNAITTKVNGSLFYSFVKYKMGVKKNKDINKQLIEETDKSKLNERAKEIEKAFIISSAINSDNFFDTSILIEFIKTYPTSEFTSYYKSILKNSEIVKSIGDNMLYKVDDSKVNYSDVFKNYKGKVVFIDVWASWCAPCKEQFKNSKNLQLFFAGKDIEFVFISLDKNIESWKKASKEEGLFEKESNYLLLNADNSDFVQSLKIKSIPRYIVIGKDGKIFNSTLSEKIDDRAKKVLTEALLK